jgi:excisionase family DNA binding protein
VLTVEQAAERFGVSKSLVYQRVESQMLTHYRVGGKGKRGRSALPKPILIPSWPR